MFCERRLQVAEDHAFAGQISGQTAQPLRNRRLAVERKHDFAKVECAHVEALPLKIATSGEGEPLERLPRGKSLRLQPRGLARGYRFDRLLGESCCHRWS